MRLDWHAIDTAPAPVRRYLHNVLKQCQGPIDTARFAQRGRLRTSGASPRWMPFEAQHAVRPSRMEFTWNAVVHALGPFRLRVVDSLIDGRGAGNVFALSVLRVASSKACLEMDSGALHRFLAEAVWYPTVLVPSQHLQWKAIDDERAEVFISTAAASVSLQFRFNRADEVRGIYTPARWGNFQGQFKQRAWEGHFTDYETVEGIRIPRRGNVGWFAGQTWQMVWEGELVDSFYTLQRDRKRARTQ
jgi:hypothetical protein